MSLAPGATAAPLTVGREPNKGTAEQGYLHCGPHGAGHFVKMVHNGIEYGVKQAYAEGFNILRTADIGKQSLAADAETAPVLSAALYARFSSRGQADFANKVLSVMRDGDTWHDPDTEASAPV